MYCVWVLSNNVNDRLRRELFNSDASFQVTMIRTTLLSPQPFKTVHIFFFFFMFPFSFCFLCFFKYSFLKKKIVRKKKGIWSVVYVAGFDQLILWQIKSPQIHLISMEDVTTHALSLLCVSILLHHNYTYE